MTHDTLPRDHLPFLDGIRGIAILGVFLFHSLGHSFGFNRLPWNGLFKDFSFCPAYLVLYPLTYGSAGVAVFFVVSGFCIHLSHQRSKDKGWLLFINRRFFRIYPPYLLAICTFFFLWPWGSFSIDTYSRALQLGTHLLAVHNFNGQTASGINFSFWSIAIEIQLYAIYPLMLFITRKAGWRRGLFVIALIEILIRSSQSVLGVIMGVTLPRYLISTPFTFWFSWAIGAYLAECFITKQSGGLSALRFDVMALIAFSLPVFKPAEPFTFLAFSILTGIAIDRLISGQWKLPTDRWFKTLWTHLSLLGVVSYSFYLFHQPILNLTGFALTKFFPAISFHPLVKFIICCGWYPIFLFLSFILYKTVEQPSISLGKMVWQRMKRGGQCNGRGGA